jgi:rhodanese-related sulfurtransferase
LSYYLLILTVDSRTYGNAIPGAWVIMWLLLAGLEGRWLQSPPPRSWRSIAIRGAIAALAGGLVFAAVRAVLWGGPAEAERNYLVQFVTWAIAWAPGILALTWSGGGADAGSAGSIDPQTLSTRLARGERLPVLDVRSEAEFAAGHVPGAINIPFTQISSRLASVPTHGDDPLFVYCGHGPRAYIAAGTLRTHGHRRIVYLVGHFAAWVKAGLPIER